MKRQRDESGLTLAELLVSIVILGLIIGPLTAATIFFLKNGETSTNVFGDNTTARLAKIYFTTDVQSAVDISAAIEQCGSGDDAVTMSWTKADVSYRSSWYSEGGELVRRRCVGGAQDVENHLGSITGLSFTAATGESADTLTVTAENDFVFNAEATRRVTQE